MRANELRHRVTIQDRQAGADELGQPLLTWTDMATVFANVNPVSGGERLLAQATHTEISHMVTIRYQAQFADPVVMAKRRLVYNGRLLNITTSRDIDERHFFVELTCTEGLNDG